MAVLTAQINNHTTAWSPQPHVLYSVQVSTSDGQSFNLTKRYSDFVQLHATLADPGTLPPKRVLTTAFVPSAWVDDSLIAERKQGLNWYLSSLLASSQFATHPALLSFLSASDSAKPKANFDPEDALPSTLSRNTALQLQAKLAAETTEATTPIAAAYYPDWAADQIPPTSLDFSKFDILLFAFATPNSSNGISYDSGSTSILQSLVTSAHKSGYGTKVVLSIGGWGGSNYFSQVMSSANRQTFVSACVSAVKTYDLDGIDIDWEYPGESGAGNPHTTSDSANLLSFFTSLRSALGSSKIISAAVTDLPWIGSNGQPLTNVSAYAAQMTYANIMNYDIFQASSDPGPNAPLGNLCGTSSQPHYSAEAAFAQWTAAGFPANHLFLGLPLYGYVSQSTKTVLQDSVIGKGFTKGELKERGGLACALPSKPLSAQASPPSVGPSKGANRRPKHVQKLQAESAGDLSSYYGQEIPFNQIVALGALKKSGSVYVQANGYTEGWENCSDTPYLFDQARDTVVTYDDTYSLGDKASYAKSAGMAGCFTWSLDQDDGYTLQDVIRSSLGKST